MLVLEDSSADAMSKSSIAYAISLSTTGEVLGVSLQPKVRSVASLAYCGRVHTSGEVLYGVHTRVT